MGNVEKQIKFLNEACAIKKNESNYTFDISSKLLTSITSLFQDSTLDKNSLLEPISSCPIFILGMPRSGTSLVEQIISSHEQVNGLGELKILSQCISLVVNNKSPDAPLSDAMFDSIRKNYMNYISKINISEKIFTDKMPANFRYIGFILSAFPEAKIVHLKRDARATCWSIYKRLFSDNGYGWSYDLDDLVKYFSFYSDLMSFWHERFPDQIYDICYEDLTTNQEEETRKLLEYCDLDWDENCLNFHSNKRPVKTASALQVRKKMYQGSSEAWKKYEAYLQPLIKGLKSF